MRYSLPAAALLIWASSFAARADTDVSSETIALSRIMELAERDNPEILAARKRWLAFQKRVPQADQALRVAEAGCQANKASFLDLLDAQLSLLNFRVEYSQFLADYEQRSAELERVVGRGV